jgi:hypothetical protein
MDKKKRKKILKQVKEDRKLRRLIELELGLPRELSHVHKTSIKDKAEKQSNKVRIQEIE